MWDETEMNDFLYIVWDLQPPFPSFFFGKKSQNILLFFLRTGSIVFQTHKINVLHKISLNYFYVNLNKNCIEIRL